LLELHAIRGQTGEVCGQIDPQRDTVSRRLAAQQDDHLADHLVDVDQLPSHCSLLEEQASAADDFRRARAVFHDPRRGLAGFFDVRFVACQPAQAGARVGDGRADRLIHFVRERRRQLAHRGHAIDVRQVRLRLQQPVFRLLTIRDLATKVLVRGGQLRGPSRDRLFEVSSPPHDERHEHREEYLHQRIDGAGQVAPVRYDESASGEYGEQGCDDARHDPAVPERRGDRGQRKYVERLEVEEA